MKTLYAPDRGQTARDAEKLAKKCAKGSRTEAPDALPLASIKLLSSVFQPRFDSVAYAPGRSEGHIGDLARVAKGEADLDPITVIAFGQEWYLIDGHHRVSAYDQANRVAPIPVRVLASDLSGAERVAWAVEASFADNKKNTLNMSAVDKIDGAWRAVRNGERGSKSKTAQVYSVAPSTVANMRKTKKALDGHDAYLGGLYSWRSAQGELRRLAGDVSNGNDFDFDSRRRKEAANRLKPVMDMHLSPGELAEALEAYRPGIVAAMSNAPVQGDGGEDL